MKMRGRNVVYCVLSNFDSIHCRKTWSVPGFSAGKRGLSPILSLLQFFWSKVLNYAQKGEVVNCKIL